LQRLRRFDLFGLIKINVVQRPRPANWRREINMVRQPNIAIVGAGLVGGSAAPFADFTIPAVRIVLVDVEPASS